MIPLVLSEILPNSLKLWWEVICSLDTSSWEDLEFLIIYNWSRIQPFIIFIIYRVQFMKVYSWYISASIQANLSYLQTVRSNQYLSKMFNIACFRESTSERQRKGAPCSIANNWGLGLLFNLKLIQSTLKNIWWFIDWLIGLYCFLSCTILLNQKLKKYQVG